MVACLLLFPSDAAVSVSFSLVTRPRGTSTRLLCVLLQVTFYCPSVSHLPDGTATGTIVDVVKHGRDARGELSREYPDYIIEPDGATSGRTVELPFPALKKTGTDPLGPQPFQPTGIEVKPTHTAPLHHMHPPHAARPY